MVWYADDLIYDGVGMIAAYSGDTLIWKKGELPTVFKEERRLDPSDNLYKGHTYIIRTRDNTTSVGYRYYTGYNQEPTWVRDDAQKWVMTEDHYSTYDTGSCRSSLSMSYFGLPGAYYYELDRTLKYSGKMCYSGGTSALLYGPTNGTSPSTYGVHYKNIPRAGATNEYVVYVPWELIYEYQ